MRDAENGEAFLGEIEWSYGFATRLLTGDEEAAMTLRGVGPLEPGTVVVDVGGGSTELITDDFRTSLDVGCVRLTERHGDDLDGDGGGGPRGAAAARRASARWTSTARPPSSPRSPAAARSRSRRSTRRSRWLSESERGRAARAG